MATIDVVELRASLDEILENVKRGEEVVITENDEPVAVIQHPSMLRLRMRTANTVAADELVAMLKKARSEKPGRAAGLDSERADEMIEALRSEWESRH